MKYSYLFLLLMVISFACKKKDEPKTIKLTAVSDGYIINANPRTVNKFYDGLCGRNIQIGWMNSGEAMRGFLTFNLSDILPGNNEDLEILNVDLKIYECNTNLHPFDGDNASRNVQVYLLNYHTLDASDYMLQPLDTCGIIATWGYNVLEEHALNITKTIQQYYQADPINNTTVQFRIQFSTDDNIVNPNTSDLDGSIWSFFAEEEASYTEMRPTLEIEFRYKDK
jgi:uncharacterized MAPEG superfamily protein